MVMDKQWCHGGERSGKIVREGEDRATIKGSTGLKKESIFVVGVVGNKKKHCNLCVCWSEKGRLKKQPREESS